MIKHKVYVICRLGEGTRKSLGIIKQAVCTALWAENVDVPCEVCVSITDDNGIHALNREYREVDRPTDVLSFPLFELTPGKFSVCDTDLDPETGRLALGDIVISAERARAQAEEYGNTQAREMAYLAVHSVLHLLGYDHIDEGAEKMRMRAREEYILDKMGLSR
ncbi:MAG: rRNA maturation RNase YbeY [Oscillospiraceae bacterium]